MFPQTRESKYKEVKDVKVIFYFLCVRRSFVFINIMHIQ